MNNFGQGIATGKIILMGEHSVVYGKPAIALPFNQVQISVKIYKTDRPITISSYYHNGLLDEAPKELFGIKQLIQIVMVYLKQPFFGIHVDIESNVPVQRGLGSSAAVSIAVVRSLFDAFDVELTQEKLNYFVDIAEQIHHENPSGLDAMTITSGKALFFQKDLGQSVISLKMDAVLVVADTGKKGLTKEAVSEVRKLWQDNPTVVNPILDRLEELTKNVKNFLENNEVIRLGLAMTEAHQLLKLMNVSDEKLEKFVDLSLKNGALGAKLTGGGRGGCMIALVKNIDDAIKLSDLLRNNGAVSTWFYDLKEIIT
ncbi:mevalonate kinase [Acholeplasma equifetale]|uniref:mevalonate kinase n=1 Tax=Acholeplasma equifetale TaxID=264634 RepID=UPI00138AAF6E|nr:mevalonate kinase [Acholeplasma equifetale]